LGKRSLFDKELIEQKYKEFQANEMDDTFSIELLKNVIKEKNVLILAPGASLNEYGYQIVELVRKENCVVISVAFVPDFIDSDYVFLSNLKRYNTTFNFSKKTIHLIHTSNIKVDTDNKVIINYSRLLNKDDLVTDNASLMLLNLLTYLHPCRVYLAGLDGYNPEEFNYYSDRLNLMQNKKHIHERNRAMTKRIKELSLSLNLEFVTPSLYNRL
jgi:4-hydroxy 2-oxovalerate aldolase